MSSAFNFVGYQLVWFAIVWSAGRGAPVVGIIFASGFVALQLFFSKVRLSDVRLIAVALSIGSLVDGSMAYSGLVHYAAFETRLLAPTWILSLWAAFAMTWNHSLAWLRGRPTTAALLGAIGAPLAYLSADRGFGAVTFDISSTESLIMLAVTWGSALAILSTLAGRWRRLADPTVEIGKT